MFTMTDTITPKTQAPFDTKVAAVMWPEMPNIKVSGMLPTIQITSAMNPGGILQAPTGG
jgi:hypothetical protein